MKQVQVLHILMAIASLLGGCAAMVGWAYGNFELKDTARERLEQTDKRLERIEEKLDRLSERLSGRLEGKGN